jgi:hypothetical protein
MLFLSLSNQFKIQKVSSIKSKLICHHQPLADAGWGLERPDGAFEHPGLGLKGCSCCLWTASLAPMSPLFAAGRVSGVTGTHN